MQVNFRMHHFFLNQMDSSCHPTPTLHVHLHYNDVFFFFLRHHTPNPPTQVITFDQYRVQLLPVMRMNYDFFLNRVKFLMAFSVRSLVIFLVIFLVIVLTIVFLDLVNFLMIFWVNFQVVFWENFSLIVLVIVLVIVLETFLVSRVIFF